MRTTKKRLLFAGMLTAGCVALVATHMQLFENQSDMALIMAMLLAGCYAQSTEFRLPKMLNGIWMLAGLLLLPYMLLFIIERLAGQDAMMLPQNIFALNYLWCLAVFVLLLAITANYRFSMVAGTVFCFLVGVVNYFVLQFRSSPLQLSDVMSVGTAADVAGNYVISLNYDLLVMGTQLFLVLCLACVAGCHLKLLKWYRWVVTVALLAGLFVAGQTFYSEDLWQKNALEMNFWNPLQGYQQNGTVLSLAMNGKYLRPEKPQGYSAAAAEQIMLAEIEARPEGATLAKPMPKAGSVTTAGDKADAKAGGKTDSKTETKTEDKTDIKADSKTGIKNDMKDDGKESANNDTKTDTKTGDKADTKVNSKNGDAKKPVTKAPAIASVKAADVKQPNIIAIMNESYADMSVLGDFRTSVPYMSFYQSLRNNTIRGNLSVSVLGGGTCNSEFEFLTGLSTAFLPSGVMAYQQYVNSDLDSMASILKAQGYQTVAFHPGKPDSWQRDKVYPHLGFDTFLTEADMKNPKYMREAYVTDSSDYKQVIKLFEEKGDAPLFLFNVTIQNHGGYQLNTVDIPKWVSLQGCSRRYPETEQYLSIMHASDKALQELITYFSRVNEPTMIVFFGDHQPSVEGEFVEELLGKPLSSLSMEEVQRRYKVPFFIWTNYDIEEAYYDNISANYLSTLAMKTAGTELPVYNQYLDALELKLPMLNSLGYADADGEYHYYSDDVEQAQWVNDYKIVQYNNLFGGRSRLNDAYTVTNAEGGTP